MLPGFSKRIIGMRKTLLSIEKDIRPDGSLKGEAQIVPASEIKAFYSLFRDPKIRSLALAA